LLQSLREFPQIRAELGGTELVITVEEDLITAEYPVSLLHSYEICVPSGAEVLVRGVSLDSFPHASHNGSYEPLLADNTDVKLYTTYALNELFLPLKDSDIVVMLQGVKLSAPTGPGVNDADFNFSYPTAGNSNITDACMEYLFAYFTYVSSGYKNIDSNLECVLSYVNPSSGLYNKLKKSKESISFVTPITREVRNEITVRETIPVSEDVYICTLYFNIDHWTYQYQKNYSGTVKLLCKSTVDGVCILDMLME